MYNKKVNTFSTLSKWIWSNTNIKSDVYCDFYDSFYCENIKNINLLISADSNYTVYINGNYVTSGQYPDYPHYKVYEDVDITKYCIKGKNKIAIIVWHYGEGNMSYFEGNASLRYEAISNGVSLCFSDENTLSRLDKCFKNNYKKIISRQLGYSFYYDKTNEDNWFDGKTTDFNKSIIVNQQLDLYPFPVKKCNLYERKKNTLIKTNNNCHYLFDLEEETVGYLSFSITSDKAQLLTICFGEHICDGNVRRKIDDRDFSIEIVLKPGRNEYTNYFRRLGLRYIEVFAEDKIEIDYISVLPIQYPVKVKSKNFKNEIDQKIYDTAVRTLQLCMHEHYEDSPWREQALYALDSRNQMLFGYYAFGEYSFPRANLLLFSKDRRDDNLLSICVPSSTELAIPSFSLYYIIAVYEYIKYSGDISLIEDVYIKLIEIIDVFIKRIEDGLIPIFPEENYWNFYEWTDGLDGVLWKKEEKYADAILNCLVVIALDRLSEIAKISKRKNNYAVIADELRLNIKNKFFDPEQKLILNDVNKRNTSELANSFAILANVLDEDESIKVAETLTNNENMLAPVTLSMLIFKYDALMKVDKEKYQSFIINDMRCIYSKMLREGATSFWETQKGQEDFDNAGSLCHGWSALPVYIYNIINE